MEMEKKVKITIEREYTARSRFYCDEGDTLEEFVKNIWKYDGTVDSILLTVTTGNEDVVLTMEIDGEKRVIKDE